MIARVLAAWERFWFEPTSTSTVALWRFCFGLLVFLWTIALGPDLMTFFSKHGLQSFQPYGNQWSVFEYFGGDGTIVACYVVLLIAAVCLMVGCFSRLASIVVFVLVVSFQRRMPYVFNAGDVVIKVIAFIMMLAPTGAAFSVDRWRKHREQFWDSPLRSPWALRLMQVQLSAIYLSAAWAKASGSLWNNGTAVYYAFNLTDLQRFPLPHLMTHNLLIVNLETYGTLALEASIGIFVWNRYLRPYILAGGVVLHLLIDYAITVAFFSWAMFVCYTSFVSPAWLDERALALRTRLSRSRVRALRSFAALPAPVH